MTVPEWIPISAGISEICHIVASIAGRYNPAQVAGVRTKTGVIQPGPGTVRIAELTGVEMLRIWLAWFIGIAAIAAPTGVAICHFYETVETVVDPCLDPPAQEMQPLTRAPDSADSALFSLVGAAVDQRQARSHFCAACLSPAPVYLLVQTPPPRI